MNPGRRMALPRGVRRFLILALAVVPFLTMADLRIRSTHDFEGKCNECHLSLSDPNVFVRDIDFLCAACHTSLGLCHPSGIRPKTALPAGFPLDWNGKMTCATCHDVHGNRESLLRTDRRGRRFCSLCHATLPGVHGDAQQPAHTGSRTISRGFEEGRFQGSIDRVSLDCLACHDAATARPATIRVGAGVYSHDGGSSHPIGVDYRRMSPRKYVPVSMLDPALVLFDGRVGCGTCHNVYSKEKHYLAVRNDRSALCFKCHRM